MRDEPDIAVHHNAGAHCYEAGVDGQLAVADYVIEGNRMILTHTCVPEALRRRGIAGALIRAALAEARRTGMQVEPRCSYAAAFLARHPQDATRAG